MDLLPILATSVLIATLTTLVLGLLCYRISRVRARRRPPEVVEPGPKVFLVRLELPEASSSTSP